MQRGLRHSLALAIGVGILATLATNTGLVPSTPVAGITTPGDGVRVSEPPTPIVAATVEQRDVPIYRTGLGSVQAYNVVVVTSRVEGELQELSFSEGQDVHAGNVLARIDSRPFEAVVREKKAQLRNAAAKLSIAKLDLDHATALFQRESGTRQAVENKSALVEQLQAQVEAAAADLDRAQMQLDYTTISSPISGRLGLKQIDVGNMIRLTDRIAVVTQLQPIAVVFTLPQEDLSAVNKQMSLGVPLPVIAINRDNTATLATGTLTTIDNQIDVKTGTLKLKATFANDDKALWPGEFVTAKLLLHYIRGATVVPVAVVQRGPGGTYAYVIAPDQIVSLRHLSVGQIQDGLAVIEDGLQPGERVVLDGQFKLKDGSHVTVTTPASPVSPLTHTADTPPR
jgi:multidrug efflux system membrane fusion protein